MCFFFKFIYRHCSNRKEIRSGKYCHLDNECQLSAWSSWSVAKTRDYFFRNRSILQTASGKNKCGKLIQKRLITEEDLTDGCGQLVPDILNLGE